MFFGQETRHQKKREKVLNENMNLDFLLEWIKKEMEVFKHKTLFISNP